ncbi:MAG: diadenylate cyclase CdaA [Bacteroidales bacterium]|nr:diadenylate cyclase CdaA [Bacteroidales bacterium]
MLNLFITGFIDLRLVDAIDVLLVAFLLYELYNLLKGTAAINIFVGIIAIFGVWRLVNLLQMELLSEILGAFISVGFIALIVVFQPEIRQFLLLIGTPRFMAKVRQRVWFLKLNLGQTVNLDVDSIVTACRKMSANKTGALIILAKTNELRQYVETGQIMEAQISDELLMNIFFKNSPLHDGAVIILNNKIKSARCILPVSSNKKISVALGLRHRAAVGVTEKTDAIAVVVSEETGEVAYVKKGVIVQSVSLSHLKNFLDKEFN